MSDCEHKYPKHLCPICTAIGARLQMREKHDALIVELDELRLKLQGEEAIRNGALAENQRISQEREYDDMTRDSMRRILIGVARALKGDPPPKMMHGWHDIESRADALVAERDALRDDLDLTKAGFDLAKDAAYRLSAALATTNHALRHASTKLGWAAETPGIVPSLKAMLTEYAQVAWDAQIQPDTALSQPEKQS